MCKNHFLKQPLKYTKHYVTVCLNQSLQSIINNLGEKHRITHTQTFFPESLLLNECGRSPGLRLVINLPIES